MKKSQILDLINVKIHWILLDKLLSSASIRESEAAPPGSNTDLS